jgi:thiol:disulfide interchange protein DsbD
LEVIFKNQKNNFSLVGKPKKAKQQPLTMIFFEVDETYFKDKAQIQQLLRVTNAETSKIEAELNYQVCKDGLYQFRKSSLFDSFEGGSK